MGGHSGRGGRDLAAGNDRRVAGDPGVLGTALAVVLAFSLAQGSWEWFSSYLGLTLLAVVLSFGRVPARPTEHRGAYAWGLAAYSLVVGLCLALALAPALQRFDWLFPMPGARHTCPLSGRYEALRTRAALGALAGADRTALAWTQRSQGARAVADCLAATTTRWLPAYALGTALLVGAVSWVWGWTRERGRAARSA